jgi:flagellar export protein FliJ
MPARDVLQVVLRLRRHKEEMEERRLAEILREKGTCDAELERVAAQLGQITAMRVRQIEQIQDALGYQECDTAMRRLIRYRADMLARIRELERQHVEQMSAYSAARSEREVIEEVHGKREALREADRRTREQKQIEELFLARRVRHSDRSAVEMS